MSEMTTEDMRALAKTLRAARAWAVALSAQKVIDALASDSTIVVTPIDGMPVSCIDIKALGAKASSDGTFLMADITATGVLGCEALRLGAHAAVCELLPALSVVGVSRNAERCAPGVGERIQAVASAHAPGDSAPNIMELIAAAGTSWRQRSDSAQVVASYLRCHPQVARVAYPGLKGDDSFSVAARTLQSGFGPVVDWLRAHGDTWHRVVCDASDPRKQVMALEQQLSRR